MTAATHDTAAIFDLIAELTWQRGGKVRHNRPGDMHISCPMPDHADRTPSCHVTRDADGAILMFCFPCQLKGKDLAPAFGDERITVSALMAEPPSGQGNGYRAPKPKPPRQQKPPREPEPECLGKHPKHSWPMVGKPDNPAVGETWFVREWERRFPVAWKVRQTCVRCGERTFHWRQPDGPGRTKSGKPDGVMPLGGLPDLIDAIDSGQPVHVYATEGDSDADAVRKAGMIAVTAGGVNDWKPEHLDQLDGVDRVTFCSDADGPGRGLASRIREGLTERTITHHVVEPVEGCKDVRQHLEAGHPLDELVEMQPEPEWSRWVDLRPYLEGTRVQPQPDVGGERDDGVQLLYPRRWHTNIALTGAGKTAFALWHAKAILDAGGHVVYLHFEEFEPDGVIDRLAGFGIDRETINKRFHWADCSRGWAPGEMAYRLTQFEAPPCWRSWTASTPRALSTAGSTATRAPSAPIGPCSSPR